VRTRVIAALDLPPTPAPDGSTLPPIVWITILFLTMLVLVTVMMLLPQRPALIFAVPETASVVPATMTPAATAASTDGILAVHTPAQTATLASTDAILGVHTATPIPTAAPRRLVIEGPISAIDGARVTIYTTIVVLRADDPLLARLRVGDRLRIVCSDDDADLTVVTAVEFSTIITITAPVAPPASAGGSSGGSDDDDDDD
jgi:hypothetical protein